MDLEQQYKSLIESLKLVASPYEIQVQSLPEFADVPFEVFSELDNSFLLMPQLIENNFLSKESIARIIRCFNWIQQSCYGDETSSLESLKNHKSWQKARDLACQALNSLG